MVKWARSQRYRERAIFGGPPNSGKSECMKVGAVTTLRRSRCPSTQYAEAATDNGSSSGRSRTAWENNYLRNSPPIAPPIEANGPPILRA
jgi:hypothetical protein